MEGQKPVNQDLQKKFMFEDIIILVVIIGIIIALLFGMFMAGMLGSNYEFTKTPPGSYVKAAHVHLLGEAFLIFLLSILFRRRDTESLEQIKKLGFSVALIAMFFHAAGLIGKGYGIGFFSNLLVPAEFSFIGGIIIIFMVYIASKKSN